MAMSLSKSLHSMLHNDIFLNDLSAIELAEMMMFAKKQSNLNFSIKVNRDM
jgi:hypothetical protein